MKGRFLLNTEGPLVEGNIYADKSSLVLDWLLEIGITKDQFSLREIAKDCSVSLGIVQKVVNSLIANGSVLSEGIRTAKSYKISKPIKILSDWVDHYSIVKKCKMWTYRSGLRNKEEMLKVLKQTNLTQKTALALHSAAEALGVKNTNLTTLEIYVLDPTIKPALEKLLQLEPQERGYEVLLIEPFYKSLLKEKSIAPPLLTYLDLYHFPLRGIEQAEFMAERIPALKQIYKKRKFGKLRKLPFISAIEKILT